MKKLFTKLSFNNVFFKTLTAVLFINCSQVSAQCGYNGQAENGVTINPSCNSASAGVGSGAFQRFNVVNGVVYDFNTCGSGYNTQITGYNSSGTYVGLFNDDNASGNNACGGGVQSGVNWSATYSGELRVQVNTANCTNWPGGGSASLNYRIAPPTTSTNGGNKTVCLNVASSGLGGNVPSVGTGTWTSSSPNVSFSNAAAPNSTATGSVAGVYTLTWTIDNGGCVSASSLQFTVDVPNGSISSPASLCSGSSANLTFTFSSGGTYDVVYSDGTSNLNANGIVSGATVAVSPTVNTTYSLVSITNSSAGCVTNTGFTSPSTTIVVNQADDSSFSYSTNDFCSNGTSNPLPVITGLGGGTFSVLPSGLAITPNTGQIDLANSTLGSNYIVTYLTNGPCPTSSNFVINLSVAPAVSFTGLASSYCSNDTTPVVLTPTPSGGTFSGLGVVGSTYIPSLTTIGSHTVVYSYIDPVGCTGTASASTLTNGLPFVTFSGLNTDYCISDNTPVTLTGQPSGGTFSGAGISGNLFTPSASPNGLQTISYSYVDPNGCTNSNDRQVNVNALPTVAFAGLNLVYCTNETATPLTGFPTGGTFSGTGLIGSTSFDPTTATAGGPYDIIYSFTDANGCVNADTQSTTVNATPQITVSGLNAQYCSNDVSSTVNASPAGGVLSGPGTSGLTFDPALAGTGTINIVYTFLDVNGCSNDSITPVLVNASPAVLFSGINAAYCENSPLETLTGLPLGGTFSGPGISGSTFNPATAGAGSQTIVYSFTDANSCSDSYSTTTLINTLPLVAISNVASTYCINNTVGVPLTGSPVGGIFDGNGVNGSLFTPAYSGIGSHDLLYIYTDANGCSDTATTTTNVLDIPVVDLGNDTSICTGTSILLNAGSGFVSYQWNNSVNIATQLVSTQGIYSVIVTDANGCEGSDAISVTQGALLNPIITTVGGVTTACEGDTLVLAASAGFTSYAWSDGATSTSNITVTVQGAYSVTVTDGSGCSGTSLPVNIGFLPRPQVAVAADGPTTFCVGDSVTLDAGFGFIQYNWTGNVTTQSITINQPGTYSVTVVAPNGCDNTSGPINVIVNFPPNPVITVDGPTTFCKGGSVNLTVEPAGQIYLWSSGSTTQYINVTETGDYSVTVLDGNGCIGTANVLDPIFVDVISPSPVVTVLGNTFTSSPFITYQWYLQGGGGVPDSLIAGANNSTFTATVSGTYYVLVTDAGGCEGTSIPIEHTYTGIMENSNLTHFNLFPNPAQNFISLEFGLVTPSSVVVSIVNSNGQSIRNFDLGLLVKEGNKTLNLDGLAAGLYSIVLNMGNEVQRSTFIKQ